MRVLFCNVGWMEFYRGLGRGDAIKGGGSFVETEERGGEVCNFEPHDGFVYGYVRPPGKTIDTKRIAGYDAESIDNVLIVWTAPRDGQSPTVVVGWYRNATVFRGFQEFVRVPPVHEEDELTGYRFKAKADDAELLPIDSRTFKIRKHKKGLMGQSNIWYADSEEGEIRRGSSTGARRRQIHTSTNQAAQDRSGDTCSCRHGAFAASGSPSSFRRRHRPCGWRKRVGVEPTRHVVRVSPDLKSERPTGVRSSSSVLLFVLLAECFRGRSAHAAAIAAAFGEPASVEELQQLDGEVASDVRLILVLGRGEASLPAIRRPGFPHVPPAPVPR